MGTRDQKYKLITQSFYYLVGVVYNELLEWKGKKEDLVQGIDKNINRVMSITTTMFLCKVATGDWYYGKFLFRQSQSQLAGGLLFNVSSPWIDLQRPLTVLRVEFMVMFTCLVDGARLDGG